MSISGIYAVTNSQINTGFSTGSIDIKINTYELNTENKEVEYGSMNVKAMPGDDVSLIPKISNLGEECYIRFKVEYVNEETDFINYVSGFSNDFIKHGDYYYFENAVKTNEVIKLFDTITVPETIENRTNTDKIELTITAQAIQLRNFEPDYTLDDPWNGIEPIKSTNTTYTIDENSEDKTITIEFENGAEKDISVKNDFFKNIPKILPGDSFEGSIEINNNNKKNVKYYLELKENISNNQELELLKKINITITNSKGQVIYDGKIADINKTLIGNYSLNEKDKLNLKLSLPIELGNEYANIVPRFSLVFSAEYKAEDVIKEAGGIDRNKENNNTEENKKYNENIIQTITEGGNGQTKKNPKTGDSVNLAIAIFLSSAIGLIVIMILAYIERRKEEY